MGGNAREAARSLLELRASRYHHEFVKRAVVLSMDRKVTQQESVSELFHFLFQHEVQALGVLLWPLVLFTVETTHVTRCSW